MAQSSFLHIRATGSTFRFKAYPAALWVEQLGVASRWIPYGLHPSPFDGQVWDVSALAALIDRPVVDLIPLAEHPITLVAASGLRVRRWREVCARRRAARAARSPFGDQSPCADLSVRIGGNTYHVTLTVGRVGIKQPSSAASVWLSRAKYPVYVGQAWDIDMLAVLLGRYHAELLTD